ncbi:YicC/YloC family endoribonuclease, partial [Ideonella azotifigens]
MTGFASASASPVSDVETALPGITVEIRTVNSRFLDIAFRLPDELRQLEPAMRELLVAGLRRGKVELRAAQGRAAEEGLPQPSPEQLNRLSRLETSVQAWLPKAPPLSVHEA